MRKILLTTFLIIGLAGCAVPVPKTQQTQLQMREYQTRTYETADTKLIMKGLLNNFQDKGYAVKNAVMALGLIAAEKQVFIENPGEVFAATFWAGGAARWKVNWVTEATANVSLIGTSSSNVRVNLVGKIMDNRGVPMYINNDAGKEVYQDFFATLDKSLFIQSELYSAPITGLSNANIGSVTGKLNDWEVGKVAGVKESKSEDSNTKGMSEKGMSE